MISANVDVGIVGGVNSQRVYVDAKIVSAIQILQPKKQLPPASFSVYMNSA